METIEDIVREMREWWMRSDNEEADAELTSFANRIEEAWEIKLIAEKAKAAAEGYVQGQQSVTDCNQPKDVPTTEKSSQVGNAAAMREALGKMRDFMDTMNSSQEPIEYVEYSWAVDTIDNALSAPPRNCDRFKNYGNAIEAFEKQIRSEGRLGFINPFTEVVKWLFAEAKGEKK